MVRTESCRINFSSRGVQYQDVMMRTVAARRTSELRPAHVCRNLLAAGNRKQHHAETKGSANEEIELVHNFVYTDDELNKKHARDIRFEEMGT